MQTLLDTGVAFHFGQLFVTGELDTRNDLLAAALSTAALLMHNNVQLTSAMLQCGISSVVVRSLAYSGAPDVLQAAVAALTCLWAHPHVIVGMQEAIQHLVGLLKNRDVSMRVFIVFFVWRG